MLPYSKIRTIKSGNRPNAILVANLRTSEMFKPRALSDYEKKKAAQKAAIHAEIQRVGLLDYNV